MPLILNGTTGVSGVDGSAGAPSYQGTDTNTGVFFPAADTIAFAEGGVEVARFDSSGNLGLGNSSPASRLDVTGPSGVTSFTSATPLGITVRGATGISDYSGIDFRSAYANSGTVIVGRIGLIATGAGSSLSFGTSNSYGSASVTNTAMTIDPSGNVGIGTSSPSATLDVRNTSNEQIRFGYTGTPNYCSLGRNSGTGNFNIFVNSAEPLLFGTNNTERMRIDSSGNLGLGVTPSAWGGLAGGAFQNAGNGALYSLGTDGFYMSQNVYFTLSGYTPRYVQTRAATEYRQTNGIHQWLTAPSGTAGNAISFTESMRIDSSGNLLVGRSSTPSVAGARVALNSAVDTALQLTKEGVVAGRVMAVTTGLAFGVDLVDGATERMRIDSSGNLLVGKTAQSPSTVGFEVRPNGTFTASMAFSTSAASTVEVYSTTAGLYRFYVNMAGTVFATNTTISGISDQRLKENVQDLDVGLDAVMALKPRKFDWKDGKGKDIKGDRGFVAQEFETVFPDLVDEWKDPSPDGEEPYKSVRADLIPVLVKAIQEQQAMIEELKQEVALLKGV